MAHNRIALHEKVAVVDHHSKRLAAIQLIDENVNKFKTNTAMRGEQSATPPLQPLAPSQPSPNPMALEQLENLSEYTTLKAASQWSVEDARS